MSVAGLLLLLVCVAVCGYVFTRKRQESSPPRVEGGGRREPQASPRSGMNAGQVALFMAASAGDADKVRGLLHDGVDAGFRNDEWVSPLGVAVGKGHAGVVRALLDVGVDPNAPAVQDQPALFVA